MTFGRRTAVRNISFEVASGEVVALVGKNGSGKSTTLRLLAGVLAADSGEALIEGIPATRREARRYLGYVAEEDDFPMGLTVRAVLHYAAVLSGRRGAEARRDARLAAESTGLEEWWGALVARCSRGVRRRVSLAQALVGSPRALVLDEPFTGLDPEARAVSLGAVRRAAERGAAVVVSLHEARAIESLAERLIVLADGGVIASGGLANFGVSGASAAQNGGGDWLAAAIRQTA